MTFTCSMNLYTNTYWEPPYQCSIVAWATSLYIDKKSWIYVCVCRCTTCTDAWSWVRPIIIILHNFNTFFSIRNLRITPLIFSGQEDNKCIFHLIYNGSSSFSLFIYLFYLFIYFKCKENPLVFFSNSNCSFRFLQYKSFSNEFQNCAFLIKEFIRCALSLSIV